MTAGDGELSERGRAMFAQLTDLLPVMRSLNEATRRLAAALPGPAHPVSGAPTVDEALAEVNAAIDDYCAVSLNHSGLLN